MWSIATVITPAGPERLGVLDDRSEVVVYLPEQEEPDR
jgi:hypothetical protein